MMPMILRMDPTRCAMTWPPIFTELMDVCRMLDASATGLAASFVARKMTEDDAVAVMKHGLIE